MSITNVDWKHTTEEIIDGILWYKNPQLESMVSVYGDVKTPKGIILSETASGRYSLPFSNKPHSTQTSLSQIMKALLGIKLTAKTVKIVLKDDSLGWVDGNITFNGDYGKRNPVVSKYFKSKKSNNQLSKVEIVDDEVSNIKGEVQEAEKSDLIWTGKNFETLYTEYSSKTTYHTEDGAEFPSKELAIWHQDAVNKGKSNAQIVLDYNGGYVLAEKIFLNEVIYQRPKPYVNFCDVMNNNKGVVELQGKEYCLFDKGIDLAGFHIDETKQYTLNEADTIVSKLLQVQRLQKELEGLI